MSMLYDPDTYMRVEVISSNCSQCKRLDVDTIGKEEFKIERQQDGSTRSVPDGYLNILRCKHLEECKKIFEEGYHVEPERSSTMETINQILDTHKEELPKIEKKPTTRKPRKSIVEKEKKPKKTTTKKVAAKK